MVGWSHLPPCLMNTSGDFLVGVSCWLQIGNLQLRMGRGVPQVECCFCPYCKHVADRHQIVFCRSDHQNRQDWVHGIFLAFCFLDLKH